MAESCLAAALDYARMGLLVFPAPRGLKMSLKSARHNGGMPWGATKDPIQIERDWKRWPDANVCIVCGAPSGIWVLDVDVKNGIDGRITLAALTERNEPLPLTLQATSDPLAGSVHHYFSMPSIEKGIVIRNSTGMLGPGIDVRGTGGMVVAPPSVKADGTPYRWLNHTLIIEAPQWLIEEIARQDNGPPRLYRDGDGEVVFAPLVAETVKHIPPEIDWSERNRIGMAIWVATGGSDAGLEIWDAWLRRSGRYDAGSTWRRWQAIGRCRPTQIGYGSLLYRATNGYKNMRWVEALDRRLMREVNGR